MIFTINNPTTVTSTCQTVRLDMATESRTKHNSIETISAQIATCEYRFTGLNGSTGTFYSSIVANTELSTMLNNKVEIGFSKTKTVIVFLLSRCS